jgi:hypothetical protein
MPEVTPHFFETTVLDRATGAEGVIVSLPGAVLDSTVAGPARDPYVLSELLGVGVGVSIPSPDDIVEVFYASLVGRVVPFDDFSFERWRSQRIERQAEAQARFAVEFATQEFAVVEESPLDGSSLTGLATRGAAWTVGGWQAVADHPLRGLGVVIVGEFGIVLATAVRAFNAEFYIWARYHLRRFFGTPPDWRP